MKVKEGFEMQKVCGEHIIIPAGMDNVDFSKIISLNPTAAYLWENVAEKTSFTVEDMAELLFEEYEVESDIALEDCKLIAETWKEMGLIEE